MRIRASLFAFTLVELMVVLAIVALLATVTTGVVMTALGSGRQAKEINAGRQLMIAHQRYAQANDDRLIPGYSNDVAYNERGEELFSPVSSRYPWRLAPYFEYDMNLLYGNDRKRLKADQARGEVDYTYAASVTPSFGINGVFVGGDNQMLNPSGKAAKVYGDFCLRRAAHAADPTRLIVFATAAYDSGTQRVPGYFRVEPPKLQSDRWDPVWKPGSPAAAYGQVDFRHRNRAVTAQLDGHVETLEFVVMKDMRRWSNQAAHHDDRDFRLGSR